MLITQLKAKETIVSLVDGKKAFIINCQGCKEVHFPEKEAAELLAECGKPEQTIEVNAPDVPTLLIGDKVMVSAGNLNTYFIIIGIIHYPDSKRMTMQLEYEK